MVDTFSPGKPVDVGSIDEWHDVADVIVVGFGGAGACAALEAAASGARVMLLEVASGSGGTTALAGGQIYIGGGTPIQQACGFEDSVEDMELPKGCQLVGLEFLEESADLPSFRHPTRAAYVLGPEMGDISPELLAKCAHTVKIPMKFCVNVGVAGALTMYDRVISMGSFADRPVKAGGAKLAKKEGQRVHRRIERSK